MGKSLLHDYRVRVYFSNLCCIHLFFGYSGIIDLEKHIPLKEAQFMTGIISYGAYIPLRRLGPGTQGWSLPAEKAVANWDEDSLTMAVAAARNCLREHDRNSVDGLYLASTTTPYREKLTATTAAWALDLRPEIPTADCTDSLRCGTGALRMAADAVKAGSARRMLVAAADLRLAMPRGGQDHGFGDGAAAFLVGDTDVIATLEDSCSLSNELLDVWRAERARFVRSWEDRFVFEEGYLKILPQAVNRLLQKNGLSIKDINRAVYSAPDARRHREMGNLLGLQPAQVQEPLLDRLGDCGSAFSLLLLAAALEKAAPGERILLASYGDGADAFLLRVTDKITSFKSGRGIKSQLASKMIIHSYDEYLAVREFSASDPDSPFGAASGTPSTVCRASNAGVAGRCSIPRKGSAPAASPRIISSRSASRIKKARSSPTL
jgi:hydroxymethylglutaryl-CoA synthase